MNICFFRLSVRNDVRRTKGISDRAPDETIFETKIRTSRVCVALNTLINIKLS